MHIILLGLLFAVIANNSLLYKLYHVIPVAVYINIIIEAETGQSSFYLL